MDLHPGVSVALRRFTMTETDVAKAIRDGMLASPIKFANSLYVALRVSGIGASYRHAHKEYVLRPEEIWSTPEMLERLAGLPIIVEHPPGMMLNTEEYRKRNIGTSVLPYLQEGTNQPWTVARIIDGNAAEYMRDHQLSTSPAVVFLDPTVNETIELDDKDHLLVEGNPTLIDHLAIVDHGVWDALGPPSGVDLGDAGQQPVADARMDAAMSMTDWSRLDAALDASRRLDIALKLDAAASKAARLDAESKKITIEARDQDGQLAKFLKYVKDVAGIGHSFEVVVDPDDPQYRQRFFFDGDGPFRIISIT